ncbi:helicase-exonuclease AddAB subunit AddB [Heyndrickxia coagulans]|uniref:ATP-dependent helicase/deoxyribonuclease subunit B n=1 Tax=Heyndrickxia coagulans TaxID=1398 RepID=A0A150K0K6_HEYCO|nr:helicase-exonuclease AddAB subunit AddB [Heyndrickxia coagulans]KYC63057.1 hypothetical protein B4098_0463 [Heyndrickxia coagulans]UJZ88199.1 helicase-exonuclease AddAB subunit AddB [Heyndrickxia coagulans]
MSLRFITGRPGTGKTTFIQREIRQKLLGDPGGAPLIYLVPEQMTFLSETRLAHEPELGGMIRAQVYSFTRLAWKILQEVGGISRTHVSSSGLNMLIRKILEDQKEELSVFTRAADKTGFIDNVERILTEFKRFCVSPAQLQEKRASIGEADGGRVLSDKLHDLERVYQAYEQKLEGKYIDSEDYLRLLASAVEKSRYLQDAEIYIDGFHTFNPQEYLVIGELLKKCRRVTVALTTDRAFRGRQPDDLYLFRMPGEAYAHIYELARAFQIETEEDVALYEPARFRHESLRFLQSRFEELPFPSFPGESSIEIWQANNRRAEIEGVARSIREAVMEGSCRYRDIAILVRNGEAYQDLIETVFYDYDVPYFIDRKRPMLNHPLIELIRSTLEIIRGNWRYEPVFRAIKTELLFPPGDARTLREKMDRLENYCLAYGIQGERWTSRKRWEYRRIRGLELENLPQTDEERKIEQELNELRLLVTAPILRLSRRLKRARTGKALCEALYLYLEELEIPEKLEALRLEKEEAGDLVAAREHDQAWDEVMGVLDQYVEILGDEPADVGKFSAIMETGLESLKFSIVPPALDQVLVANLEQSRLSDVKLAFIIGANDGVMPAKISEDGVLNDEEREYLRLEGLEIMPGSKRRLLDEEFIFYRALTTPSEKLVLSFPLADEEGKALLPSPFINRIEDMFPARGGGLWVNDPAELEEKQQAAYISHPAAAIAFVTSQLQLKKRGYPMAGFWWDTYNFYMENPEWKNRAAHAFSSLFYQNKARKLSEKTSRELYGDHILASVSRMEQFFTCPFSHFSTYGLRLRERDVFRLDAPNIGDLFHGALKWISDTLQREGIPWSEMTKQQSMELAKAAVDDLAPKLQHQILLSSKRYQYIKRKLEQVVGRASYILSVHAKRSGFEPVAMELAFGPKKELPPLSFTLKNGAKMELQGRIDRVDKAESENGVYVRIIDYKSSAHKLDLTNVYYGLDLQMLTYLDLIMTYSKQLTGEETIPAGVLYFHLHDPLISAEKMLTAEEIEEEILKDFRMRGLLLDSPEVITLMDQSLESGNSAIVSAGLKKDGQLTARSEVASKEDFEAIRSYVRNIYTEAGNAILSGTTDIAPYKIKKQAACTFCPFRSVCQFDQSMEENNYRLIHPEKPEEILAKMRKERRTDENSHSG